MQEEIDERRVKARNLLATRKTAYVEALGAPSVWVESVMMDLAKFCRADASCFDADPRVHAALEGRREVYLRIQDHLKLPVDALLIKYGGRVDNG